MLPARRGLLILLLLAPPAPAQDSIKVTGKYTLVVQETPFTLTAPAGGDLYFWSLPPGWTVTDQNDSVVVTKAPAGSYSLSVTVIKIEWDQKKTTKKVHGLSLSVGVTPAPDPPNPPNPPKPPDPPPPTPDSLGFAALASAEAAKVPAKDRALAADLAANFEAVAAQLAANLSMTVDQANALLRDKNRATLGTSVESWRPFFVAWQAHMDRHNAAGLTGKEHYVRSYTDTAAGLRKSAAVNPWSH